MRDSQILHLPREYTVSLTIDLSFLVLCQKEVGICSYGAAIIMKLKSVYKIDNIFLKNWRFHLEGLFLPLLCWLKGVIFT
jgi:hypothetical protein